MKFNKRLKQCRLEHRFTQEDLAQLCGVSRQAVAKWEGGDSVPDLNNLMRISEIFNMSIDTLLTGKEIIPDQETRASEKMLAQNEKLINKGLQRAMASADTVEEIQTFIEYGGRMMSCDRIYIFELDACGNYANTYEWCKRGVEPQIANLQGVPYEDIAPWIDTFKRGEHVLIENVEALKTTDPVTYSWLAPQGIKSLLAISLFDGKAFLGIDNPAMAFLNQSMTLLELSARFLESMLQRSRLMRRLLIETSRSNYANVGKDHADFYINLKTHAVVLDGDTPAWLGNNWHLENMDDLKRLLDAHPECRDRIIVETASW